MSFTTVFALAVMSFVIVWVQRKNSMLKKFWQKASKESLVLRTELSKKENELRSCYSKISFLQNLSQGLERQKEHGLETISKLEREEKTSNDYFKNEIKRLSLTNVHYKEQVDVMTKQLQEADELRSAAIKELTQLKNHMSHTSSMSDQQAKALQDMLASVTEENIRLKKDVENLEKDTVQALKDQTKSLQAQIIKLKKYLINSSFLYKGMKGLKEMSDERNKNLQTACKALASWVIKQQDINFSWKDASLGSLIACSLESIGQTLVDDSLDDKNSAKDDSILQQNTDLEQSSDQPII